MTLMFITFLVILLLGAPIYVAIGGSALLPLVLGVVPLDATLVPQATINGMSNSVLVAVALFFIAGSLMESSDLTKELLEFADSLVGHMYGGMGMATIVASAFFAALTGSGLAATVAIGSITIGGMVERRYSKPLAGAVAATGGALGVLIPPSNPMIIYAVLSGTSVGALFTAGLVPGILITVTLSAVMYVIGRKNKLVDTSRKFSGKAVLKSIWKSKWALLAPRNHPRQHIFRYMYSYRGRRNRSALFYLLRLPYQAHPSLQDLYNVFQKRCHHCCNNARYERCSRRIRQNHHNVPAAADNWTVHRKLHD